MAQADTALPKQEDVAQEEVTKARQQLKSLRESLVKRVVQRVTNEQDYAADLRAHPDQYPLLDGNKVNWELMVARMVVTYLLEPTTTLPTDVECLHRRVRDAARTPLPRSCAARPSLAAECAPDLCAPL